MAGLGSASVLIIITNQSRKKSKTYAQGSFSSKGIGDMHSRGDLEFGQEGSKGNGEDTQPYDLWLEQKSIV